MIRAGGHINEATEDCTWRTCMGSSGLEWGVAGQTTDNPHKDVDNTGNFGPENIYLESAPPGLYHVMVEHWGGGMPSTATLQVAVRETTASEQTFTGLVSHHVWYAGTLEMPSGVYTPMNMSTDCTASWSGGCMLMIP